MRKRFGKFLAAVMMIVVFAGAAFGSYYETQVMLKADIERAKKGLARYKQFEKQARERLKDLGSVEDLQTKLDKLTKQVAAAEASRTEKIDLLEAAVAKYCVDAESAECKSAAGDRDLYMSEDELRLVQIAEKKQRMQDLGEKIGNYEVIYVNYNNDLQNSINKIAEYEAQIADLKNYMKTMPKDANDTEKCQSKQAELNAWNAAQAARDQKVSELQSKITELQNVLSNAPSTEDYIAGLNAEKATLQAEQAANEAAVADKKHELAMMPVTSNTVGTITAMKQDIKGLTSRGKDIKKAIKAVDRKIANASAGKTTYNVRMGSYENVTPAYISKLQTKLDIMLLRNTEKGNTLNANKDAACSALPAAQ